MNFVMRSVVIMASVSRQLVPPWKSLSVSILFWFATNQTEIGAKIAASVEEDPEISIRRRSVELIIAKGPTRRILRLDLGLHPYKIVLMEELKPYDHRQGRELANWTLEALTGDPDFNKKKSDPFLAQRMVTLCNVLN